MGMGKHDGSEGGPNSPLKVATAGLAGLNVALGGLIEPDNGSLELVEVGLVDVGHLSDVGRDGWVAAGLEGGHSNGGGREGEDGGNGELHVELTWGD